MAKKRDALDWLVGTWAGTATTWFEPGAEPLVEKIRGRITVLKDSNTLTHVYRTRVQGKAAHGTALIGTDNASLRPCLVMVDSFHTTGDLMMFQADDRVVEKGFSVRGQYAAPSGPPWLESRPETRASASR